MDEARKFLESARNDGDPMYAAYVLILILGLRKVKSSACPGTPWTSTGERST
ncbi:hypothetical protein [Thermomonospora echinospora]|uniref:hypothetical protein n=1 Tax=Thermomonospora echinospora TaxID=1992 RepID=UPI00190E608C|nr:hypothetical protein [Thermomonospora echinospora]